MTKYARQTGFVDKLAEVRHCPVNLSDFAASGLAAGIAFSAGTALLVGQSEGTKSPTFEVASVKLVPPPQNHPQGFRLPSPNIRGVIGNRFTESSITVTELIMKAYDLRSYQIFGLPSWGDWLGDQFEILAKTEGSGPPPVSQVRLMLQSLLTERFHLKVHRAFKELPVYELVLDRNGPKLTTVSSVTPPEPPKNVKHLQVEDVNGVSGPVDLSASGPPGSR